MATEVLLIIMGMALVPLAQHAWNLSKGFASRDTRGEAMTGFRNSLIGMIVSVVIVVGCFIGIWQLQVAEDRRLDERFNRIEAEIREGNDQILDRLDKLIEIWEADNGN
jgi:hypothetical protein